MDQVIFLTVFLGIVAGPQRVALNVTPSVVKVELHLDHQRVATLTAPPWAARVDFGPSPLPHRLEARAYDRNGAQVAIAMQKINVSTPPRDLRIAVEETRSRKRARVVWSSIDTAKPDAVEARLDGDTVPIAADGTIVLPARDDGRIHLLEVTARAARQEAEAQLVFGGIFESTATAELSAIPVRVRDGRPQLASLRCAAGSTPVRAVAIDDLPAEVLVVRDPSTAESAARLDATTGSRRREGTTKIETMQDLTANAAFAGVASLSAEDRVRFLWPAARAGEGTTAAMLFFSSRSYSTVLPTDFRTLLTRLSSPLQQGELRYADAVAVAGMQAAQSQRPRAVVLVLGSKYDDKSRMRPAEARAYLARLGVPLFVWSLVTPPSLPPHTSDWGEIRDASTAANVAAAVQSLRQELDLQRILWVEGDYLATEVTIAGDAVQTLAK